MEEAIDFFDTNLIVASAIDFHPHHEEAFRRLTKLRSGRGACAAHSLAEAYSTLTRGGKGYSVPTQAAQLIVEEIADRFTLVSLTAKETMSTIQQLAGADIAGPILFDGLLLACARKINARFIYTKDIGDFRRIAPDLASRIRLP